MTTNRWLQSTRARRKRLQEAKYVLINHFHPHLEHSFHATQSAHNIVADSLVMIHPSTVQLGRWEGQVKVQELVVGFYRHHDEVVNAKQLHLNISNFLWQRKQEGPRVKSHVSTK